MPTVEQIKTLTVRAKQEGFDALSAALNRVSTAYGVVQTAANSVSTATAAQKATTGDVAKSWEAFSRRMNAVATAAARVQRDLNMLGKAAEQGKYLDKYKGDASQYLEQDIQKALRPLDDIRAKYDEVFAVQRRHLDLVKEVNAAENLGILTAEKAAQARLKSAEASAQEVAQLRVAAELRKATQIVGPYQPVSASSFGNAEEQAAYAAQINKIRAEYDKVLEAQQRYDEKLQKVVADHRVAGLSAESLAKEIAKLDEAHAKAIASIDGTAEAEDRAAKAMADAAKEAERLDRVRSKYDKSFDIQQNYNVSIKDINEAEAAGRMAPELAIQARIKETVALNEKIEAQGRALNELRAIQEPLLAAEQKYRAALEEVRNEHAAGATSAEAMNARLKEVKDTFASAVKDINDMAAAEKQAAQAAAETAAQLANLKQEWSQFALANDETARAMEGFRRETDLIKRAFDQGLLGSGEEGLRKFNAQIDAAKQRLQDLSRVSRGVDQSDINKTLGVNVDSSGSNLAAEMEKDAASIAKLRAAIDPLGAKQAEVNKQLGIYRDLLQRGQIGADDYTRYQKVAAREVENFERALNGAARTSRVTSGELANLSFQVNDVVTGLALGQSPFMILTQQGGQVFQVFQQSKASVGEFVKEAVLSFGRFLTVGKLAIGGVTAGFFAATAAASQFTAAQMRVNLALQGAGRGSGVTRGDVNAIAEQAASPSGLSVSESREMAATLASSGRIAADSFLPLVKIGKDVSRIFGVDVSEAGKLLAEAFSDPATGVDKLNARLAAFDATVVRNIKNLTEQGDRQKAQMVMFSGLQSALAGTNIQLGTTTQFWTALGNKLSDVWDKFGELASRASGLGLTVGEDEKLTTAKKNLKQWQDMVKQWEPLVEQQKKWGSSEDDIKKLFPEYGRATEEVRKYTEEVKKLTPAVEDLRQKQKEQADEAQRVMLSQQIEAAVRSLAPLIGQYEALDSQAKLTENGVHKLGEEIKAASSQPAAIDGLQALIDQYNKLNLAGDAARAKMAALQSQTKVGILGAAATPQERLKASIDAVTANSLSVQAAAKDAEASGAPGATFDQKWEDRAIAALKLGAAIEVVGARMSALGQSASVQDVVTAKTLELARLQQQGAGLTPKQIAQQKELARVQALGVLQIRAQNDNYKVEAEVVGMSVEKATAYRTAQNLINEARRIGKPLTEAQTKEIEREAAAMGKLAQAAQVAQLANDIKFDRSQIGLSDSEVSVNAKIRSIFNGDANSAQAQFLRQQLLVNDALKQYSDISKDATKGFISDIIAGKNALESLSNALTKIGNKLIDMAVDGLWSKAFGGSGGIGSFVSNLFGGGASPEATALAAGTRALAGGGQVRGPGSGTSDSVPAWLSNGEFVVNAAATAKHLPLLQALNDDAAMPKFATGGLYESGNTGKSSKTVRRLLTPDTEDREWLDYVGAQPRQGSAPLLSQMPRGTLLTPDIVRGAVVDGKSGVVASPLSGDDSFRVVRRALQQSSMDGDFVGAIGASRRSIASLLSPESAAAVPSNQSRVLAQTVLPGAVGRTLVAKALGGAFGAKTALSSRDKDLVNGGGVVRIVRQSQNESAVQGAPGSRIYPSLSGDRNEIVVGDRIFNRRIDDALVHPAYYDEAPASKRPGTVTNERVKTVYRDVQKSVLSTVKEALTQTSRLQSLTKKTAELKGRSTDIVGVLTATKSLPAIAQGRVISALRSAMTAQQALAAPPLNKVQRAEAVADFGGFAAAPLTNAQKALFGGLEKARSLPIVTGPTGTHAYALPHGKLGREAAQGSGLADSVNSTTLVNNVQNSGRYIHPAHFDDAGQELSVLRAINDNVAMLRLVSGGDVRGLPAGAARAMYDSGGYTGAGGKYEPAGIVHKGEVVWSQQDVARAGGVGVVEAMRLGYRGYADGGVVDAPLTALRRPSLDSAGDAASGSQSVHVTVGVTVDKNGNLQAYVQNVAQQTTQSGIRSFAQGDLKSHVIKTVKDGQAGRVLK